MSARDPFAPDPFEIAPPHWIYGERLLVGPFDDPLDFLRAVFPGLYLQRCERDDDDEDNPTFSMILLTPEGDDQRIVLGTCDQLARPRAWQTRVWGILTGATKGRTELVIPRNDWPVVFRAIIADGSRNRVSW